MNTQRVATIFALFIIILAMISQSTFVLAAAKTDIDAYWYDPRTEALYVQYKNTEIFGYYDVPEEVYQELKESNSTEAYITDNIVKQYESAEIENCTVYSDFGFNVINEKKEATYEVNTKNRKYHKVDSRCKPKNAGVHWKYTDSSEKVLRGASYSPCKTCFP